MEKEKFRVLVVDDEKVIRENVIEALNKFSVECFEAENGRNALRTMAIHKPDLVLLDLEMPLLGGIGMLKDIKSKYPRLQKIPVIILTASSDKYNVEEALKMGVKGYILKPFSLQDLLQKVNEVLQIE